MRVLAVHLLTDRAATDRAAVTMACGLTGRAERWPGEFTTLDGRDARLSFVEDQEAATCRSCLRSIEQAMRRG